MSNVVKTAIHDIPTPRGHVREADAASAAEEATVAAAEAIAAEAAAGVAAEAAASAALMVSGATAVAAEAAVRARRTAEAAAAIAAEAAAGYELSDNISATVGGAAATAAAGTASAAAAWTVVEARNAVAEAIAAEKAAAVVAEAAATASAMVIAASAAAASAAARSRQTTERAATSAAEAAQVLITVAATAAEATLDAASATAKTTLDAASATAKTTLETASAAEAARGSAARASGTLRASTDGSPGAALTPNGDGPAADRHLETLAEAELEGVQTEWTVMLADPVMARFAWDRAETQVSFSSPAEKGLWRDISLARRMEAALRVDVAEVEGAFFNAPAAMAVLATSGRGQAEFLRVNPAFSRLTGYPLLKLLGLCLDDLAHAEDDLAHAAECTIVARMSEPASPDGGVPHELIRRWVHADGHELRVRIRLAATGATGGQADRWVCQVEDVTVSARAEESRRGGHAWLRRGSSSSRHHRHHGGENADHSVLFHRDDAERLGQLVAFVELSLTRSEHAVVIVTAEDADAIRAASPRHRLTRSEAEGRIRILDTTATLAGLMRDGVPAKGLFERNVGDLIRHHAGHTGSVSVFGSMVGELWKAGNVSGALQLEELWNQLRHRTTIGLTCAYPLADAQRRTEDGLARICHPHSQVYVS